VEVEKEKNSGKILFVVFSKNVACLLGRREKEREKEGEGGRRRKEREGGGAGGKKEGRRGRREGEGRSAGEGREKGEVREKGGRREGEEGREKEKGGRREGEGKKHTPQTWEPPAPSFLPIPPPSPALLPAPPLVLLLESGSLLPPPRPCAPRGSGEALWSRALLSFCPGREVREERRGDERGGREREGRRGERRGEGRGERGEG
jgi:hypothetical protein